MAKKIGADESAGKSTKETSKLGVGDSAGNLTQDTFLQSAAEMAAMNAKVAAVNEERKSLRKVIKSRGIELGDLDETMKKADWDREEVRAQFERRRKYAEWLGLPHGTQANLFEGMSADEKAAAEWEMRGRTHALAGRGPQPPEECPDGFKPNWTRGYKLAKGEKVEDQKPAKEKVVKLDERAAAKARTNDEGKVIAPSGAGADDAAFADVDAAAKAKRDADKLKDQTATVL